MLHGKTRRRLEPSRTVKAAQSVLERRGLRPDGHAWCPPAADRSAVLAGSSAADCNGPPQSHTAGKVWCMTPVQGCTTPAPLYPWLQRGKSQHRGWAGREAVVTSASTHRRQCDEDTWLSGWWWWDKAAGGGHRYVNVDERWSDRPAGTAILCYREPAECTAGMCHHGLPRTETDTHHSWQNSEYIGKPPSRYAHHEMTCNCASKQETAHQAPPSVVLDEIRRYKL